MCRLEAAGGDDLVPCHIRLTLVPADVSSAVLSPCLRIPCPAAPNAATPCPVQTWESVCMCHQPVTRQNSPLVVCSHLPACFFFYPFFPVSLPQSFRRRRFSSPPLQPELLIIFPLSVSVRLPPLHLANLSSPPSLYLIHTHTHTRSAGKYWLIFPMASAVHSARLAAAMCWSEAPAVLS